MKILNTVLVCIMLFAFTQVKAQDSSLTGAAIPQDIQSYVQTNFPSQKITSVQKEKENTSVEYDVRLDNNVELEFNEDFSIEKIDGNGTAIPGKLIPKKIKKYVAQNYPDNKVVEWQLDKNRHKIELNNDKELYFDSKGKYLGTDD